jgi:hypothetical protein
MTLTLAALLISTVAATSTLALGYGLAGLWPATLLLLALGSLWLLGQQQGWGWVASVALVFFVGAAAVGLWLDLGAGWMLLGVVAALSAWDLDRFTQRQRGAERIEKARELERRHLQRLLIVDSLGLLLATAGLQVRVGVSFGGAFSLTLLAVLGLSRVIGFLRRESD